MRHTETDQSTSTMNSTRWSGHYLTDHLIMSVLLGTIGAVVGWILGTAVVIEYARIGVSVLHAAWAWAWDLVRGGSLSLRTTPAWVGYIPTTASTALMLLGATVGWVRSEEHTSELQSH